ncbi:hypothetical protein K5X82_11395 [Halosquirtibacter xylanolyticus]|uniref:hypothetical protein n=1 Tax=Halosquirtibacter xylanolyticus TaxID=3374599 RepID=UPI0037498242|nr:hypothetical protein K5X82_11395 [Prolixibacteraceae bacterium]
MKKDPNFNLKNFGIWIVVFGVIMALYAWKEDQGFIGNVIMSTIFVFPTMFPKGKRKVLNSERIMFISGTVSLLIFYSIATFHAYDLYATIVYIVLCYVLWFRIYKRDRNENPNHSDLGVF